MLDENAISYYKSDLVRNTVFINSTIDHRKTHTHTHAVSHCRILQGATGVTNILKQPCVCVCVLFSVSPHAAACVLHTSSYETHVGRLASLKQSVCTWK